MVKTIFSYKICLTGMSCLVFLWDKNVKPLSNTLPEF